MSSFKANTRTATVSGNTCTLRFNFSLIIHEVDLELSTFVHPPCF